MNQSPPTTSQIVHVAVPTPLRRNFDYYAPKDTKLLAGMRVKVPFGKRILIGVIVGISNHSDFHELKSVIEVIDSEPFFTAKQLELITWASNYYHYPLGMLFDAILPTYLRKNPAYLPADAKPHSKDDQDLILNTDQKNAIAKVSARLNEFSAFLLDGVTGSGKTEVYMQLIEKTITAGKQALVLVPEINLTPQTMQRFQQRFAVPIALLHSQVAEKQRATYWLQAKLGIAPIVLGTRLAAFTPLKNPGIFIIDEEHDLSFKQQDRFRYSARDLLLKRGHLEQCPVLLGTATPSLETWHNVQTKRFEYLHLPKRAGNAQLPELEVIDVRHKQLDAGMSNHLLEQVRTQLANKQQVLIFLNRRGYAPVVMCCNCGWHQTCNRCDSNMIYHAAHKQLRCHHCAAQSKLPTACPTCNEEINLVGLGTQRIEEALQHHFPAATIARVDKDTAGTKNKLQDILAKVHNKDVDILIGTQMLAKGHHFPDLTLVAIIDMDSALFSADFRALERLGQLLTQVSGRTGRGDKAGKVILQTTQPEHPVLTTLLYKSYHDFIDMISKERSAAMLPPYSSQVLIRAETKSQHIAQNFLHKFKQLLTAHKNLASTVSCLGPIAAPMEKRQGFFRAQLLLQATQRKYLQLALQQIIPQLEADKSTQRVRWSIDVDPLEMY